MKDLTRDLVECWASDPTENKVTVLARELLEAWEQLEQARERKDFCESPCPEERADDAPGFTQEEAYWWYHRHADQKQRADKATQQAEMYMRALESVGAHEPRICSMHGNTEDVSGCLEYVRTIARNSLKEGK
jgi:hypothetical protein